MLRTCEDWLNFFKSNIYVLQMSMIEYDASSDFQVCVRTWFSFFVFCRGRMQALACEAAEKRLSGLRAELQALHKAIQEVVAALHEAEELHRKLKWTTWAKLFGSFQDN